MQLAFEPVIERIRFSNLSSMMVLSDFLSRYIAPLQSHVCRCCSTLGRAMPRGLSGVMGLTWPQTCRGPCWGS
jgi:hypothetical protein